MLTDLKDRLLQQVLLPSKVIEVSDQNLRAEMVCAILAVCIEGNRGESLGCFV